MIGNYLFLCYEDTQINQNMQAVTIIYCKYAFTPCIVFCLHGCVLLWFRYYDNHWRISSPLKVGKNKYVLIIITLSFQLLLIKMCNYRTCFGTAYILHRRRKHGGSGGWSPPIFFPAYLYISTSPTSADL